MSINLATTGRERTGPIVVGGGDPFVYWCGSRSEKIYQDPRPIPPDHRGEAKPSEAKPLALVVDDVPDVTQMLTILLRHAGYDVTPAYSAVDALAAARRKRFQIIVSDIGMPGMNGYQLAEELRALPDYREVPLIAVTGFALYDDRERALQAGFSAFLTKPVDPLALLELITRLRD